MLVTPQQVTASDFIKIHFVSIVCYLKVCSSGCGANTPSVVCVSCVFVLAWCTSLKQLSHGMSYTQSWYKLVSHLFSNGWMNAYFSYRKHVLYFTLQMKGSNAFNASMGFYLHMGALLPQDYVRCNWTTYAIAGIA